MNSKMMHKKQKHTPKILFVTSGLSHGGAAKRILLIKNLLANNGLKTTLFAEYSQLEPEEESIIDNFYKQQNKKRYIRPIYSFMFLVGLIKKNKYDIIVCNSRRIFPICKLLSFFFKIKYVNLVQIKYRNALPYLRLFYGKHILAVSRGVVNYLVEEQRLNPPKITLITNSSPPLEIKTLEHKKQIKTQLGINGAFIITCIARFHAVKGHKYLIEAFDMLAKKHDNVKLLLMGFGDCKNEIEKKITHYNLWGKVIMVKSNYNVSEVMAVTDLLVLPSLREGLPTVILEGFSVGKTIVATDIPGTNEIVKNGHNGLLVPVKNATAINEAIETIMLDDKFKLRLEKNALKTYKKEFSFEIYKSQINNYFCSLLNKQKLVL
jgi:L-malate glycosyltransferase